MTGTDSRKRNHFLGRDPETVATDVDTIRRALGQGFDEATAVWHSLDAIARTESASTFTRQRAHRAAVALGSLLDDLAAADEAAAD